MQPIRLPMSATMFESSIWRKLRRLWKIWTRGQSLNPHFNLFTCIILVFHSQMHLCEQQRQSIEWKHYKNNKMDPRDLPSNRYGIDINKIDPKWIENCKSVKKLRAAVRTLKEDGYYPDLTKMAEDKLCQLDPEYKRRKELPHATAEEKQEAEKELNDFLAEIAKPQDHSDEKRKLEEAKKERLKGNECMAGQEYKEAVRYYEKSLKLDPNEAATYSNRALAYLKLNDYKNALNDANAAIDLMPEYLKAYHRRAEAFLGLGEYAKAYSDVKAILLVEPQNAAAKETKEKLFKKIKTAKVELDEEKTDKAAENIIKRIKEPKPQPTEKKPEVSKKAEPEEAKQEKTKDGFVKVAISEDASDSSESEEEPSKPVPEKPKQPEKIWSEEEIKPAKPEPEPTAVPAELDKIFATYNFHKEEGNKLHKSGQYDEAIKRYLQALSHMESIKPPKVSQDEYTKREAVVNSNIAVCYKQMQDSSNVIHYATKVINSKVDDTKVLLKALVLRAYAYESVDKLLQAKEDWTKVKELQWDNMDASRALERINEAVKREKSQRIGDTLNSIQKKLEECKTAGNNYYKVGEHLKAIEQFSNGIELFLEKCDVESMQYTPKDLMQIVCQLYTNRAICNHVLNRHLDVIDDAGFVINKLDPKNAKAFYRRGVALAKLGDYDKSLADLQQAANIDPNNALIRVIFA
eukprot:TRINITY_DN10612_c0_g1_i2.p1 TRINITY_DN10612_c0_g1~~TRINITY_DN10612_c0_g1_i2.p1  ORF type:complete len:690 (+),score=125.19 TRINITY_DN10612_c0_g1_i2:1445-3514(+)